MTDQTMTTEQGAWPRLTKMIREYIDDYHLEGDGSWYTPTRRERFIAEDIINCMLEDDDMAAAIRAALSRPAVPEVTDDMALAFHRAISDGSLGQSDVDDIKIGLRRVFELFGAPAPAPAVPKGWKLVPETMPIGIDDVANLLVMCGDPSSPDEFSDCFLWVGETRDPDGRNSSYGLNVALSEYPEEGSNPFVLFDPPPLAAAPEPAGACGCTTCASKNARELYEELLDRYTQTRCGCGHPACKRCRDDGDTEAVLARARGENVE